MGAHINRAEYIIQQDDFVVMTDSTIYQHTEDCLIIALDENPVLGLELVGFIDNFTPPTTKRQASGCARVDDAISICMRVKAGDYYKVVNSAGLWRAPLNKITI